MTREEKMEMKFGSVFVHESGHALMADLLGITCQGIYFETNVEKFCTLSAPPSGERSKEDYLISAAGSAAELLVYPDKSSEGADADRADFCSPYAPSFDEALSEAFMIMSREREKLGGLVAVLKATARRVDCDWSLLPETGMDGCERRFRILLDQGALKAAINHN